MTRNSSRSRLVWLACALAVLLLAACGAMANAPETPYAGAPATAAPATSAPVSAPTSAANPPPTSEPQPLPTVDLRTQLNQVDAALRRQMTGSIAYNKPESMNLDETAMIELLLNPAVPADELGTQVTEPGSVQTATVEITPQMKAVLISPLAEAFTIQPIQDEVQLISASETTRWSWSVTARESGTQKLLLVISRLVKFEGQDYWREVETYTANIKIDVPFARRISSLDWKWIVSVCLALASMPFIWNWVARRRRKSGGG